MYQTASELDCKLFVKLDLDPERSFVNLKSVLLILDTVQIIVLEQSPKMCSKMYGSEWK